MNNQQIQLHQESSSIEDMGLKIAMSYLAQLEACEKIGEKFARSGMLNDSYYPRQANSRNPDKTSEEGIKIATQRAAIAISNGFAIGMDNPRHSVDAQYVVNGKPSLYGEGVVWALRNHPDVKEFRYEWLGEEMGNDWQLIVHITTIDEKHHECSYSQKMARQAGWFPFYLDGTDMEGRNPQKLRGWHSWYSSQNGGYFKRDNKSTHTRNHMIWKGVALAVRSILGGAKGGVSVVDDPEDHENPTDPGFDTVAATVVVKPEVSLDVMEKIKGIYQGDLHASKKIEEIKGLLKTPGVSIEVITLGQEYITILSERAGMDEPDPNATVEVVEEVQVIEEEAQVEEAVEPTQEAEEEPQAENTEEVIEEKTNGALDEFLAIWEREDVKELWSTNEIEMAVEWAKAQKSNAPIIAKIKAFQGKMETRKAYRNMLEAATSLSDWLKIANAQNPHQNFKGLNKSMKAQGWFIQTKEKAKSNG